MVAVCGEEKRQIIFPPAGASRFTDIAIDHRLLRVAFETRAKASENAGWPRPSAAGTHAPAAVEFSVRPER